MGSHQDAVDLVADIIGEAVNLRRKKLSIVYISIASILLSIIIELTLHYSGVYLCG